MLCPILIAANNEIVAIRDQLNRRYLVGAISFSLLHRADGFVTAQLNVICVGTDDFGISPKTLDYDVGVFARGLALICDSVVVRLAEPVHALIETDAAPPGLRASHFGGSEAGKADQD